MRKTYFLAGILVCLMSVQAVAGFSVSAVTINPSGELFAETPVTVTFDIPCKDIRLYDQLVITTDLKNPAWDTRTIIKGKESPVISAFPKGNTLTIPGAVFNLQTGVEGNVHVQLEGMVPPDPSASRNLLHIRQVDADGIEYAYPTGFDLPMYIPPTPAPVTRRAEPVTVTMVQTTDAPSFAELIAAEPSTAPRVLSTPVKAAKNRTRSVPTPWAGEPPATESPVDPVISIGATAGVLYAVKRPASE